MTKTHGLFDNEPSTAVPSTDSTQTLGLPSVPTPAASASTGGSRMSSMFSTGRNKQVSINDTLLKNAVTMLANTVGNNSSSSSRSGTNNGITTTITSNNNISASIQASGVDTANATTATSHSQLSRSMSMPAPASTSMSHFPPTAQRQELPKPSLQSLSRLESQLSNTLVSSPSSHKWVVDRHTLLTTMSPVHLPDYTIDDTTLPNDYNMVIEQRSIVVHSITSTNALQVIFQSVPVHHHNDNRNNNDDNNISTTNSHCEMVSFNRDDNKGQNQLLSILLHHIAPPPLELSESSQRWLSIE